MLGAPRSRTTTTSWTSGCERLPSFVVHAILPLLVLLSWRRLDARKVWLLWPLTFLPDMDYFFGFHRATLGNVFVVLPAVALAIHWWRAGARSKAEWALIAAVYLGTHILMDVFTGGSVLLYPFSDYTFCYLAAIDVVTATNTPIFYFQACSREGIPVVSPLYPWLTVSEGAMLAFLVPAGIVALVAYAVRSGRIPASWRFPRQRIR